MDLDVIEFFQSHKKDLGKISYADLIKSSRGELRTNLDKIQQVHDALYNAFFNKVYYLSKTASIQSFTFYHILLNGDLNLTFEYMSLNAHCFSATNIISVNLKECDVGDSAFTMCKDLEKIYVDHCKLQTEAFSFSGVKNLEINNTSTIPEKLCSFCKNLDEVRIGEGCTTIESNAFEGCNRIKSIYLPDSLVNVGSDVLASLWHNTTIYCSDALASKLNLHDMNCRIQTI